MSSELEGSSTGTLPQGRSLLQTGCLLQSPLYCAQAQNSCFLQHSAHGDQRASCTSRVRAQSPHTQSLLHVKTAMDTKVAVRGTLWSGSTAQAAAVGAGPSAQLRLCRGRSLPVPASMCQVAGSGLGKC